MTLLSKKRRALLEADRAAFFASLPHRKPTKPIQRKPRTARESARIYGDAAFKRWLHEQPCCVPGDDHAFAPQAHHIESGGMGYKADATLQVLLCGKHHREIHDCGVETFQRRHRIRLERVVASLQQRWRAECARRGIE